MAQAILGLLIIGYIVFFVERTSVRYDNSIVYVADWSPLYITFQYNNDAPL